MAAPMADEDENEDETEVEEGEEGEGKPKKKLSGKVIILFIALPALLLLGGGGAAAYFFLLAPKPEEEMVGEDGEPIVEEVVLPDPVFYEMPELLVNLSSGGSPRPVYLKIKVRLELRIEDDPAKHLDPMVPRLVDRFQVFLRQLRVEDIEGSAGTLRLKHELLRRINLAVEEVEIEDVLFDTLVIQ